MGKESITPTDADKLVEFNRGLMQERGTHFGVNREELDRVFQGLDQFRSISDKDKRIISMAAWIAYGIAKERPFFNGNKRTASIACVRFLNANGYDLLIELLDVKRGIHELLTTVQDNEAGLEDIRDFVKRKAVTFQSR